MTHAVPRNRESNRSEPWRPNQSQKQPKTKRAMLFGNNAYKSETYDIYAIA